MSRSRDYKAEYGARQQRARARGFSGYRQQRRFSPTIRNTTQLARLPETARATRSDALHVLQVARENKLSIEDAARREQVPVEVVRYRTADALKPRRAGRTVPERGDRLFRLRPIVLAGGPGVEFVEVRGSHAARRAQRAFDVQYRYIEGNASESELADIAGVTVAGRVVEADPGRLQSLAEAGEIDLAETYR
jgi:hypothetical protein